jgi:transcriptional regulator with XRE-family HTH domain
MREFSEADAVDVIVGRRLRARRRLLGYSQLELGAACGVTFQQVHKYDSARNRLSVVMLWKLARALDVEIGYFFAGLSEAEAVIVERSERAPDLAPARARTDAADAERSFAV